jgi:hypothetical protein
VELTASEFAYEVLAASVENRSDVFVTFIDGKMWQREYMKIGDSVNEKIPAGRELVLAIRYPWEAGKSYPVKVDIKKQDSQDRLILELEAETPNLNGYPFPGWKSLRLLVLSEDYGIPRENDPQMVFISTKGEDVASWTREMRVARCNLETGKTEEIPSQVLYEKRLKDTPKEEAEYSTCQVAFSADVEANQRAGFLFFFSNPDAQAPEYPTDITMVKDASGSTWIENSLFRASLHPKSGQLDAFYSKVFGTGPKRGFYSEKYPLHYNPDVWPKNRSWSHTSDWNPPPNTTLTTGPVAVVARRWGPLPWVPEIEVEVVYHFFSGTPYVLVESTMDVVKDFVVNALRNEEIVLAPETEVDHVGWRRMNGEVRYKLAELEPGLSRGMMGIIDADAPYVGLAREADGIGIGGIRLRQFAGSRGEDPPVIASTSTILADYGWQFRYWSRSLVYPWGDKVPDLPAILNAGTYYSERSAYCLFPLGEGDRAEERLAYLEDLNRRLNCPLRSDWQGTGPW